MSGPSTYEPKSAFTRWLDTRLPILRLANDTMTTFPTPRNLNFWYGFGAVLTFMLAIQIVTGIVLAMHYVPNSTMAFDSVENIMRDVNYGWLLRYMHANGASSGRLALRAMGSISDDTGTARASAISLGVRRRTNKGWPRHL